MSLYKLPRAIKHAKIIYPGCPLTAWYSQQADKPDILFNASLYRANGKPIGTVVRNGLFVSNAGGGVGFGTKNGALDFGAPWSGWDDYLTAYYAVVQDGATVAPPWRDAYVFGQALNRISVGQMKDGTIAVFCENNAKIEDFAKHGLQQGFTVLCNLDGGGSRALLWLGKWVYTSARTPFNAVAIWLEPDTTRTKLTRIASTTVTPCGSDGIPQSGRRIDIGDKCTVHYGAAPIPISYPILLGTRSAYVPTMNGLASIYNQNAYGSVPYPAPGYLNATVKSGGCGPTAASIVVETLAPDASFDPRASSAFAIQTGARVSGGTDMGVLSKRIAEKFWLTVTPSSAVSELRAHLARGGIAIANVAGVKDIFSTGGHYVVVLGEQAGMLSIADPGYYAGKYGAKYPARKKAVTVKGSGLTPILLASPDVLDADCSGRVPRYYLFSR